MGVLLVTLGVAIGTQLETAAGDPVPITATVDPPLPPSDIAGAAAVVSPAVVQLEVEGGLGSGVIYDSDGLILTAAHVVEGASSVEVRLADGRLFEGTVIGRHELTDVAVIGISGSGLPVASLGYGTSTRVGETAIALGSPFGLNRTVTAGIVSATGRTVNGVPMVQTDAAINPGNSGGPLINASGQVIGINDIIFTQGGGNDGIGFAVSIDVAIVVADQIVAGDPVQLASLGVATIPDVSGQGGAIVREVVPNSAAEAAGIRVSDRITSVDGLAVSNPSELFAAIVSHRPAAEARVEFRRDGRSMTVTVALQGISR